MHFKWSNKYYTTLRWKLGLQQPSLFWSMRSDSDREKPSELFTSASYTNPILRLRCYEHLNVLRNTKRLSQSCPNLTACDNWNLPFLRFNMCLYHKAKFSYMKNDILLQLQINSTGRVLRRVEHWLLTQMYRKNRNHELNSEPFKVWLLLSEQS